MEQTQKAAGTAVLSPGGLQALIEALAGEGYTVLGPTVHDGAIVYDEVSGVAELPSGWTDRQDAGRYRLERREDGALFGFAVGPHSWKRFLHPPAEHLWTARKTASGFEVTGSDGPVPKYAFLGVRACEIEAIAI